MSLGRVSPLSAWLSPPPASQQCMACQHCAISLSWQAVTTEVDCSAWAMLLRVMLQMLDLSLCAPIEEVLQKAPTGMLHVRTTCSIHMQHTHDVDVVNVVRACTQYTHDMVRENSGVRHGRDEEGHEGQLMPRHAATADGSNGRSCVPRPQLPQPITGTPFLSGIPGKCLLCSCI